MNASVYCTAKTAPQAESIIDALNAPISATTIFLRSFLTSAEPKTSRMNTTPRRPKALLPAALPVWVSGRRWVGSPESVHWPFQVLARSSRPVPSWPL